MHTDSWFNTLWSKYTKYVSTNRPFCLYLSTVLIYTESKIYTFIIMLSFTLTCCLGFAFFYLLLVLTVFELPKTAIRGAQINYVEYQRT